MDEQRRAAAPPQYSPDGRWWWDGQSWVPVRPPTPVASPRRRRSTSPIWIAVAALLVAALGLTVVAGSTNWLPTGLRTVILGGGGHRAPSVTHIAVAPPPGADAIPTAGASLPPAGTARDQAALAARVVPATVNLSIELHYDQGGAGGSGIVLTSNGLVLTDEHVTFQADSITAKVGGRGRTYDAAIIGADPVADVALIQLKGASGLTAATFGDPAAAHVDDAVIGIGYPDDRTPDVVSGHITSLSESISTEPDGEQAGAHYRHMLVSTLDTKPGMSGGPVVDSAGRVVGMIESGEEHVDTAAVRTDVALDVARRIAAGRADAEIVIGLSAELGVAAEDATDGGRNPLGARVTRVHSDTPAQAVGLHFGDTITAFGGSSVTTARGLELALIPHRPGDRVAISWSDVLHLRHQATVVLGRGPAP